MDNRTTRILSCFWIGYLLLGPTAELEKIASCSFNKNRSVCQLFATTDSRGCLYCKGTLENVSGLRNLTEYESDHIIFMKQNVKTFLRDTKEEFVLRRAKITLNSVKSNILFRLAATEIESGANVSKSSIEADFKSNDLERLRTPLNIVVGDIKIIDPKKKSAAYTDQEWFESNLNLLAAVYEDGNGITSSNATLQFKFSGYGRWMKLAPRNGLLDKVETECIRLDEYGNWTTAGCMKVKEDQDNGYKTECSCGNSTDSTMFGVRLLFKFSSNVSIIYAFIFIVFLLQALSCILLFVSMSALLAYRKKMKSSRTFIGIGIAMAFFGQGIISLLDLLFHYFRLRSKMFCQSIAILNIYFSVVISCWLLIDAVVLLLKITLTGRSHYLNLLKFSRVIAITICTWLIPAIVVFPSAVVELNDGSFMKLGKLYEKIEKNNKYLRDNKHYDQISDQQIYSKYEVCTASPRSTTFYVSLVFSGVNFLAILVISFHIAYVVWQKSIVPNPTESSTDFVRVKKTTVAFTTLAFSLGLPQFAMAIAATFSRDIVSKLIIRVFAGVFQGPSVFYFHCWRNPELVRAVEISKQRWKQRRS